MTKKIKILYVEDDETLAYVTKDNLERNGYKIEHFENGQIALSNFTQNSYNICILDIMLPKMDGFELAKQIRRIDNEIPIIFLSAKSQTDDRIHGLEVGADDYLVKPFSIEELILKIEVFIKRNKIVESTDTNEQIAAGKYILDISNQVLIYSNQDAKLTHRETLLIGLFFKNQNKLIKREELLMKIWGDDSYFNGRSLDVFVSRVRKLLKSDTNLEIENIRSIGFRFNVVNNYITN